MEPGRIPRTINCDLICDLVNTCQLGDVVRLSGMVKGESLDSLQPAKKYLKHKFTYNIIIKVNSITNLSNKPEEIKEMTNNRHDLLAKSLLDNIILHPNKYELLTNSLAPSIFGHDYIKAGLLLSMLGGSENPHDLDLDIRSNINVLLIGEAGMGKSKLIQSCLNISPNGNYVCGTSVTASGLTVTLVKDDKDDYTLQAGALLCVQNGICCIDEFDKMNKDVYSSLLESMEQQQISIAKGGICCTLPCKTTIIAAANPINGIYDPAKSLLGNTNIGEPLLTRFDLIFLLIDKPNKELDAKITNHLMKQYYPQNVDLNNNNINSSHSDVLSFFTIKMYIKYAKKTCNPKITTEVANVLSSYWIKLRKDSINERSKIKTTVRQLEALKRLTEARAKLDLRNECLVTDAYDIIEMFQYLDNLAYNNEPDDRELHILTNLPKTIKKGKTKQIEDFVKELHHIASKRNMGVFTVPELENIYKAQGFDAKGVRDHHHLIDILNQNALLLKDGRNYRLDKFNLS